ncbi:MAG: efflux RND transporter periplasmic adaptor subunit [Planctomycetes bacterium]|nr:efflux RND transporter periplasmic adaptor subunit [Planctomycetota bacterium]
MRALILMVAIPLAGLSTWWGVSSFAGSQDTGPRDTFTAVRKNFKVILQEKGELKASSSIDIKSEVSGRSTIISLVPEGSSVKKGELLVELASDEIEERVQGEKIQVAAAEATFESAERQLEILKGQNESNIRKGELKLRLAKLELEKYELGEWPKQKQDAEFLIESNEKKYERFQTDFEYAKTLYKKKFITKTEYDGNEFDEYGAKVALQKSKRDLEILEKYTHVKDLAQKTSDVSEAEKELGRVKQEADNKLSEKQVAVQARKDELALKHQRLQKLEDKMAKTKIFAPADGLVVYGGGSSRWMGRDDQIKEGAEVFERQTIMQLPDTSEMKVVVRIHEAQTDKIRLDQEAIIEVEGISDRKYTGRITKIAVLADSQNRWLNPELKEYETEITINESDPLLKPGVTARVEILVSELTDVVAVPVQSIYSKVHKSFVFVGHKDDAEPIEVQLGLASDEFVEIKSGLEPGQEVLLAVSDLMKTRLPEVEPPQDWMPGGPMPGTEAAQRKPRMGRGGGKRTGGSTKGMGKRPRGGGGGKGRPRGGGKRG